MYYSLCVTELKLLYAGVNPTVLVYSDDRRDKPILHDTTPSTGPLSLMPILLLARLLDCLLLLPDPCLFLETA
jgi:hypothetical protein